MISAFASFPISSACWIASSPSSVPSSGTRILEYRSERDRTDGVLNDLEKDDFRLREFSDLFCLLDSEFSQLSPVKRDEDLGIQIGEGPNGWGFERPGKG